VYERDALEALKVRREANERQRNEILAETRALVQAASECGISGPEIARALGLSHQRVYKMLEEVEVR
jgi:gamma-glutamyl phosphate reductase